MRAYLHDGQEPYQLHPKAGYIEARPNYSTLTDFYVATHTAGPYIRVMNRHARGYAGTAEAPHKAGLSLL